MLVGGDAARLAGSSLKYAVPGVEELGAREPALLVGVDNIG